MISLFSLVDESRVIDSRADGLGAVSLRGALILGSDGAFPVSAIDVDAVEPVGAEDAFTAALALFLANGNSLREATRRATIVAAVKVAQLGTNTSYPSRFEVEGWLAERRLTSSNGGESGIPPNTRSRRARRHQNIGTRAVPCEIRVGPRVAGQPS